MAILKGDWVLTDGEVGQVQLANYIERGMEKGYHLVRVPSLPFASLRSEKGMVKIDPVFIKLLTDVNKESENG
jgi:hypothetical protein